jgi:hypothetical protein
MNFTLTAASLGSVLLVVSSFGQAGPTMRKLVFGGSDQDVLAAFAIDGDGNYVIAGTTESLDLPANTLQTRFGGAFLYRVGQDEVKPLHPSQTAAITAIAADLFHPGTLFGSFSRADFGATYFPKKYSSASSAYPFPTASFATGHRSGPTQPCRNPHDALAALVVNKLRGTLAVCAVKAPGFGDRPSALARNSHTLLSESCQSPLIGGNGLAVATLLVPEGNALR